MHPDNTIYIPGHTGMVGSAIRRQLVKKGYKKFVERNIHELDLTSQQETETFFQNEKPDIVVLAAAKVGGIHANNTFRAQFIYENLMIQNNIIHSSYKYGVKKLLFLGSSCIYPKNAPQPIKEEYLLTDTLEYTNEPYAIAKIAGIKTIESYNIQYGTNYIAVMPTNLFGTNDNYNLLNSHVLPALIRKFHLAKCLFNDNFDLIREDFNKRPISELNQSSSNNEIISVLAKFGINKEYLELWGTGKPRREFLHCDELAEACVFLLENYNFNDFVSSDKEIKNTHINIGKGEDLTISELAFMIREIVGFKGDIHWNHSIPDGTMRKLLDVTKINKLGWKATGDFRYQLEKTYEEYQQ